MNVKHLRHALDSPSMCDVMHRNQGGRRNLAYLQ